MKTTPASSANGQQKKKGQETEVGFRKLHRQKKKKPEEHVDSITGNRKGADGKVPNRAPVPAEPAGLPGWIGQILGRSPDFPASGERKLVESPPAWNVWMALSGGPRRAGVVTPPVRTRLT
jgi:hypothetical protein